MSPPKEIPRIAAVGSETLKKLHRLKVDLESEAEAFRAYLKAHGFDQSAERVSSQIGDSMAEISILEGEGEDCRRHRVGKLEEGT